jgi:hypothetical protein
LALNHPSGQKSPAWDPDRAPNFAQDDSELMMRALDKEH